LEQAAEPASNGSASVEVPGASIDDASSGPASVVLLAASVGVASGIAPLESEGATSATSSVASTSTASVEASVAASLDPEPAASVCPASSTPASAAPSGASPASFKLPSDARLTTPPSTNGSALLDEDHGPHVGTDAVLLGHAPDMTSVVPALSALQTPAGSVTVVPCSCQPAVESSSSGTKHGGVVPEGPPQIPLPSLVWRAKFRSAGFSPAGAAIVQLCGSTLAGAAAAKQADVSKHVAPPPPTAAPLAGNGT
jgi:hypothetical protein